MLAGPIVKILLYIVLIAVLIGAIVYALKRMGVI